MRPSLFSPRIYGRLSQGDRATAPWVERLSRCAEQLAPRQEAFQHCLIAWNRGLVHAEGVFRGMGSAGRGCGVSTRVSFGEIS
jgi:hypothetical protein